MKKLIYLLAMVILVCGCAAMQISPAINEYRAVSNQMKLGDTKEKVLAILLPTQKSLASQQMRSPETFMQDGKTIEIYYMRSGWVSDGLTTDDEFTPYVFTDGILTAIGWTAIGGMKTHGQVVQPASYINQQQQQTTIVY
jgi:hypothetical protein